MTNIEQCIKSLRNQKASSIVNFAPSLSNKTTLSKFAKYLTPLFVSTALFVSTVRVYQFICVVSFAVFVLFSIKSSIYDAFIYIQFFFFFSFYKGFESQHARDGDDTQALQRVGSNLPISSACTLWRAPKIIDISILERMLA